jgi:DNA-directed RNA polymerase subunit RPC12/RpoP
VPERRAYDELAMLCKQSIQVAANGKPSKGGNKSILTAVLKLRIFCNTGLASPVTAATEDDPDEAVSLLQQSGELDCAECNSEILCSGVQDGFLEHKHSRHRLRCEDCTQKSPDVEGSMVFLSHGVTESNLAAKDDSVSGRGPKNSNCGPYPSKLEALLADIKENYDEDKR